jgi:predicted DNA-binding transcriptional regulator AlpA
MDHMKRPAQKTRKAREGSIDQFCAEFGISRGTFYNLKRSGKAPRTMKVGTRTVISEQAKQDWVHEREKETAAQASKL